MTKAKKDPANTWAIQSRGKNVLVLQPSYRLISVFRLGSLIGQTGVIRRPVAPSREGPTTGQERAYTVGHYARSRGLPFGPRTEEVLRSLTKKEVKAPFDRYVFLPMKCRPLPGYRILPT